MKPTQKLTLPPGIPKPPAPPKGCRWEVMGWGGLEGKQQHGCAIYDEHGWGLEKPGVTTSGFSSLFYIRAVPITTAKPIKLTIGHEYAKNFVKRGKVKARVMWANPETWEYTKNKPSFEHEKPFAILPLDNYEALVEQVEAFFRKLPEEEISPIGLARVAIRSLGITKPKRRNVK